MLPPAFSFGIGSVFIRRQSPSSLVMVIDNQNLCNACSGNLNVLKNMSIESTSVIEKGIEKGRGISIRKKRATEKEKREEKKKKKKKTDAISGAALSPFALERETRGEKRVEVLFRRRVYWLCCTRVAHE